MSKEYAKQFHIRHCDCDIRGFGCKFYTRLLFYTNFPGTVRCPKPPSINRQMNQSSSVPGLFFVFVDHALYNLLTLLKILLQHNVLLEVFYFLFFKPLKMLFQAFCSLKSLYEVQKLMTQKVYKLVINGEEAFPCPLSFFFRLIIDFENNQFLDQCFYQGIFIKLWKERKEKVCQCRIL